MKSIKEELKITNFDEKLFAESIKKNSLEALAAQKWEGFMQIINLSVYKNRSYSDINFSELNLTIMEAVFEELYLYEADEFGDDNTDWSNEGQTIVEINRIAGIDVLLSRFKSHHRETQLERSFF